MQKNYIRATFLTSTTKQLHLYLIDFQCFSTYSNIYTNICNICTNTFVRKCRIFAS